MSESVIRVQNVGKKYLLGLGGGEKYRTLRDFLSNSVSALFKRKSARGENYRERFWALKDVSFSLRKGEVLGIIGRNGAGKSTLLKILSRITEPTEGEIYIKGKVASLLEVGTGFHAELSGRENIFLNGAILGMKQAEIKRKFDEIVAFAEVEEFIDTPVKRYSSGMYVRLAFAVAAHLEPEILLVDEVLAVGDVAFQRKCMGKMDEVSKGGRTILFVSHNMGAIRQLCSTCLWIDKGKVKKIGDSAAVIDSYLESDESAKMDATGAATFEEDTKKEFQLRSAKLLNEEGLPARNFSCDKPVTVELLCQVHTRLPGLYCCLSILRKDGTLVMLSDSFDTKPNPLDALPIGMHSIRIVIPARTLGPGDYNVAASFASHFSRKDFLVDVPGVVGTFHLDDFTSSRGNRRAGYFSALLPWNVSSVLYE